MRPIDYDKPLSEEDKQWLRSVNLNDRIAANEARFGVQQEETIEPEDPAPETDDDYDEWKLAELKAEADSRDPRVEYASNVRKDALIEALRAWDRAHPEAD